MEITLDDMLAVYSGIDVPRDDQFLSFYSNLVPPSINKEFETATFLKREFNELKLSSVEPEKIPGEPFVPLNSQKFTSEYLSPHTPYDRFLVYWLVGTGKTCAISQTVMLALEQNPNMLPALILVTSEPLEKAIKMEIASICTNGKYMPPDKDPKTGIKLTEKTKDRRRDQLLKNAFIFQTIEKFASEIAIQPGETNDARNRRLDFYSNRYIFIDEAHNISPQPKKSIEKLDIYREIHHFLHIVKNTKQVLLTATPMRNRAYEIASLLNLLLPLDKQFNVDIFMAEYFTPDNKFKNTKRGEFKERIRGMISYVQQGNTGTKITDMGVLLGDMKHFPLVEAIMSDEQSEAYAEAYSADTRKFGDAEDEEPDEIKKERSGLYTNSRQAAMFVAPDGSYGEDLEGRWMIPAQALLDKREKDKAKKGKTSEQLRIEVGKTKKGRTKHTLRRTDSYYFTTITDELRAYICGDDDENDPEERLIQLGKLSSKFAGVIREILSHKDEKAFVYSNIVSEAGINMFAAILELFNFEPITVSSSADLAAYKPPKGKRHYLLFNEFYPASAAQKNLLINKIYNNAENNKYGELIQVIIGSRKMSEGYSFKQTRQFHGLTSGWNPAEITQAEGRVLRVYAHSIFPPDEQYVKLFHWCAMPSEEYKQVPSIDLKMYKLSEEKDYPIKQIERLMKEVAVDCSLNIKRTMVGGVDGSRQCDYSTCYFDCYNIPTNLYKSISLIPITPPLIVDSYNLYYADDHIEKIKEEIIKLFQRRTMYDLEELKELFPDATDIILIRALRDIIIKSVPIRNRYGIVSYLCERLNLYFLINNQEFKHHNNVFLLSWYNANPIVRESISFNDYLLYFEGEYLQEKLDRLINNKDLMEQMKDSTTVKDMAQSFSSFDPRIQEKILETFVLAKDKGITKNFQLQSVIIESFKDSYEILNKGIIVSPILYPINNTIRCYVPTRKEWINCGPEHMSEYAQKKEKLKSELGETPYKGYFGVEDKQGDFKIAKIRQIKTTKSTDKPDKRYDRTGTICSTGMYNRNKLMGLLLEFGEIAEKNRHPVPDIRSYLNSRQKKQLEDIDIDELYNKYITEREKEKGTEKDYPIVSKKDILDFSDDKLQRWAAILLTEPDVKSQLCPALKEWFASLTVGGINMMRKETEVERVKKQKESPSIKIPKKRGRKSKVRD